MKILKTPWKDTLLELTNEARHSIKITAPFVKHNICQAIFEVKKQETAFELITAFKLPNVYAGALDLTALNLILEQDGIVRNHPKLHAKIYLFDDEKAVVTSGNLTNGGLINNFEYGLLLTEKEIVKQIVQDFDSLVKQEITGCIKKEHILKSTEILAKIPKQERVKIPRFNLENPAIGFENLAKITPHIASSLSGWKLVVFYCLDKIPNQHFSTNDVYSFEKDLQLIYPKNRNVKDKIRQQIQYLRDLGLIEFLDRGNYRKLW